MIADSHAPWPAQSAGGAPFARKHRHRPRRNHDLVSCPPHQPDPARGELALRVMTALLMASAAALVLIGAEAWCGALVEPSLIQLIP